MMEISGDIGIGALADDAYLYNQRMNFTFGMLQVMVLLATLFVSVFKPWGGRRSADS